MYTVNNNILTANTYCKNALLKCSNHLMMWQRYGIWLDVGIRSLGYIFGHKILVWLMDADWLI